MYVFGPFIEGPTLGQIGMLELFTAGHFFNEVRIGVPVHSSSQLYTTLNNN